MQEDLHLLLEVGGHLGEVEVEDGEAPAGDVPGGQAVHHEHGPHLEGEGDRGDKQKSENRPKALISAG